MKFKDYINEQDELDILQGKMGAMNKKLAMFKRKIEQTGFKVIEVYQGELESDPGFELEGGFSIQMASPNHWILTQEVDDGEAFQDVASGAPNKILNYLKKVK